jgi:hypothetical protein
LLHVTDIQATTLVVSSTLTISILAERSIESPAVPTVAESSTETKVRLVYSFSALSLELVPDSIRSLPLTKPKFSDENSDGTDKTKTDDLEVAPERNESTSSPSFGSSSKIELSNMLNEPKHWRRRRLR